MIQVFSFLTKVNYCFGKFFFFHFHVRWSYDSLCVDINKAYLLYSAILCINFEFNVVRSDFIWIFFIKEQINISTSSFNTFLCIQTAGFDSNTNQFTIFFVVVVILVFDKIIGVSILPRCVCKQFKTWRRWLVIAVWFLNFYFYFYFCFCDFFR